MAVLHRKLARDLLRMSGQAVAIALVIACGVAAFVSMRAMYRSLLRSQSDYYAAYRFADVFAELKRAPEFITERIQNLPGVARAESRVVTDVTLDIPGLQDPAVGRLISLSANPREQLNALFLRQGRYVLGDADDEAIVSEAFANANHLLVGAQIGTVINGRWQKLTIVGIALSPEYIYEIRGGGSVFPDNKRFGVLWTSRHALEAALNMKGAFNSISVLLEPNARAEDVIPEMDRILGPYGCLGAYGRDDQISNRFISDEISQNRISANVIPAIFLGVAVLLVHFSFVRLVGIQRPEIGAIKAFGYSNWQVGTHYFEFSLAIAALGYVLGCAIGWSFGIQLASLYAEYYRFPMLTYAPEPRIFIWSGVITTVTAALGAISAVSKAAALPPAEAMRPEAPPEFRTSLVDRLRPRWISPATRMMLRNVERTRWRTLGSAFAICCAVMIVVVEFGLFDSLDRMLDLQFREIQREDMTLTLNEAHSERTGFELARLPGVIEAEPFRAVPIRIQYGHRRKTTTLVGLPQSSELRHIVNVEGNSVEVPADGLLISSALASALQVGPGDTPSIEVLEGRRSVYNLPVSAVVEDPFGTAAYIDIEELHRLLKEDHLLSGAFLQVDTANEQQLYQLLKQLPAISAVSLKQAALNSSRETIDRSMSLSIGTLLIFACVIAAGMVYNGARIALSERARELATLRVLGFTSNEITLVLLGEQSIITAVAIPFGFAAGYGLCAVLSANLQTELYRMPLIVQPASYAWAFLVVALASILSGLLVRRRIAHLDIVSVLKARE